MDEHVIILIWVDDLIIAANNVRSVNEIKSALNNNFKMTDLGQLSWFLGISFEIENDCIKMHQTKTVERILERFQMTECNPKTVPCNVFVNKEIDCDSKELSNPTLFREILGSLIYLMSCTRPDLGYIVSKLSQYMQKPTHAHLNLCKFVLKYLKGSKDYCLKFRKSYDEMNLIGHCDSDWGGTEDRRSVSGYCFLLNSDGPLISWKSKKQPTVALSSCEAEYCSITFCVQEAKFLSYLMSDMMCTKILPVNVHVDNQGAIMLAKNPVQHQRSKHIDIKYHFIRSEVESGSIVLNYIPTDQDIADLFTKPVSKIKFRKFDVIHG